MATEDVLERYARMLRDQNWSDLARQQVMDEMAAELRLLQKDRERLDWLQGPGMKPGGIHLYGLDIRKQIDAAMAREGEK